MRWRVVADNVGGQSLRCHEHDADFGHGRDVDRGLGASENAAGGGLDQALKCDETGGYVGERTNVDGRWAVEYGGAGEELDAGTEDCLEIVEPAIESQATDSLGSWHLCLLVIAGEHAVSEATSVSKKRGRRQAFERRGPNCRRMVKFTLAALKVENSMPAKNESWSA